MKKSNLLLVSLSPFTFRSFPPGSMNSPDETPPLWNFETSVTGWLPARKFWNVGCSQRQSLLRRRRLHCSTLLLLAYLYSQRRPPHCFSTISLTWTLISLLIKNNACFTFRCQPLPLLKVLILPNRCIFTFHLLVLNKQIAVRVLLGVVLVTHTRP